MRILILPEVLAFALLSMAPGSAQAAPPSDDAAIRAVVERFRLAIIARDAKTLAALPLNDAITFASAADARTLATVRARRPDAKRLETGSYPAFVGYIGGSKAAVEEKFSNIVIRTDSTIASVHFAYRFEEAGVETNRGEESWGLINTDDGWKISSIIYSVSLPPATK